MSSRTPAELVIEATGIGFARPAGPGGRRFELVVPRLEVRAGETLAVCGPSGSGKSTLLAVLAGLLRPDVGVVRHATETGWIDPYACSAREWRRQRGHLGFVLQDPRESLNDRRVVADIVADPLAVHGLAGRARRARAIAALHEVGLTRAQAERTPEALSGEQRQRVAIARAIVARPRLIFFDEPMSTLDVSVKAAIVDLLRRLRDGDGRAAYVLVTHDLALARHLADRVVVLDRGRVVETGTVEQVFESPASPVTRALLGVG